MHKKTVPVFWSTLYLVWHFVHMTYCPLTAYTIWKISSRYHWESEWYREWCNLLVDCPAGPPSWQWLMLRTPSVCRSDIAAVPTPSHDAKHSPLKCTTDAWMLFMARIIGFFCIAILCENPWQYRSGQASPLACLSVMILQLLGVWHT